MTDVHFGFLIKKHAESYRLINYAQNIQETEPKLAAVACLIVIKKVINQLHGNFCIVSASTSLISQINQPLFIKLLACANLHKRLKYSAEVAYLAKDNRVFAERNLQSLLKTIYVILLWWDKLCSEYSLPSNDIVVLRPKNLSYLFSESELNNMLTSCYAHAIDIQKCLNKTDAETHFSATVIRNCYRLLMSSKSTRLLNTHLTYDGETEFDFSSLRMVDYFNQYRLGSYQSRLIDKLENFITNSDIPVMIIKTVLTNEPFSVLNVLTQYALQAKIDINIISPSAQSAIRQKNRFMQRVFTISEFIENVMHASDTIKVDENYISTAQKQLSPVTSNKVIVLYSASLYSENINDSNNFGRTDSSLSTLIQHLKLTNIQYKTKLIIIGDDQALPVNGAHFASALSQNYLYENFGLSSVQIKLNTEDSYYNSNNLCRNNSNTCKVNSNYRPLLTPSEMTLNRLCTLPTVNVIDKNFHAKNIFKHFFSENSFGKSRAVVIAYTQTHADGHNMIIRQQSLNAMAPLVEGERIMTHEYSSLHKIGYQALGIIKSLSSKIEKREIVILSQNGTDSKSITLNFQKAIIQFPGYHTVNCYVLMNFLDLYTGSPNDCKILSQSLEQDFINRMMIKYNSVRLNDQQLEIERKNDIYLNALKIKYAYAQTVHQAYACTWTNVLIDCKGYADSDSYYFQRWLYTAVASTIGNVYLLNVPSQECQSMVA